MDNDFLKAAEQSVQRTGGIRPAKLAVFWLQLFPLVDSFCALPPSAANANR